MKIFIYINLFTLLLILVGCSNPLPDDIKIVYEKLPENIDFNFHIRPILADRCYSCHGPDDNTRQAGLRLDLEDSAFAKLKESGGYAFVKGNVKKSVAWQRIISSDPELQMPPAESNLSLTENEKALIAKWIEQGAEWKKHWAFVPPTEKEIPIINQNYLSENDVQIHNPIDNFILEKVIEQGLTPSKETHKERLIRRLSFDLRGLPPTIAEIDRFLVDDSSDAYENLVQQFLASDAHAERMAMDWMDVARFADSHGVHADGLREMWPYRDWVIKAFKDNLRYDDFVTWQLAGDLIPGSTREQKLATAFQRNQVLNSESGIISEEYRLKYVSERANTTATAFMGLTMECATCHDHKFDPISQKEYYQMTAFFNNMKELGMIGNDKNFGPLLLLPNPTTEKLVADLDIQISELENQKTLSAEEIENLDLFITSIQSKPIPLPQADAFFALDNSSKVARKNKGFDHILDKSKSAIATGEHEVVPGKIGHGIRIDKDNEIITLATIGNFNLQESFSGNLWVKTEKEDGFQTIMGNIGDKNTGSRGWIFYLDSLRQPSLQIVHSHSHNYLHVEAKETIALNEWVNVCFTYDGSATAEGIQIFINGQTVEKKIHHNNLYKSTLPVKTRRYIPDPERKLVLGRGHNYIFTDTDNAVFVGSYDHVRLFDQVISPLEVAAFYQEDTNASDAKTEPDRQEYLAHYLLRQDENFIARNKELSNLRKDKFSLLDNVHEVMVQDESMPRKTYILERGQYDALGEEVFASTPAAILEFPKALPNNRLGLTKWLFDDQHPLTSRVAVNRYWQMIFGKGIVTTPHDFGTQGSLPTHPELLDWLAIRFKTSNWNVQELLTLMVTSATYRQSAVATPTQLVKDANNTYLSRGASYRLQAEMIRDNSLAASGLLSPKIGGASVKPYQPEGLWKEKNEFSGYLKTYEHDSGDSLYRRSLYTFIRRTSPPPAMITFDAPQRDVCTMKRETTNTPMQALVLLNDPQFIEAARMLAERMQKEGGLDIEAQTQFAFRTLCGRKPNPQELLLLKEQYNSALRKYQQQPESAVELLQVGEYPFDENLDKIETAALTMVANTIMNFDEAYMKR